MKGRDGRKARAKELWRIPKVPPTVPASIKAVNKMVDGKSFDESKSVPVAERASKTIPQKMPPRIIRIEPTSEVIAIPS